jgi:hypothetical protein
MAEYVEFDPRAFPLEAQTSDEASSPALATPATPATQEGHGSGYCKENQELIGHSAMSKPSQSSCYSSATPATQHSESSNESQRVAGANDREDDGISFVYSEPSQNLHAQSSRSSSSSRGVSPVDEPVPDGCVLTTNPMTGQQFLTRLYRCPGCGGTPWGPRADGMWHCLTCAAHAAGIGEYAQPAG